MGTVENLIAARALIDTPEKWQRGRFTDGRGCFCAAGAIREVVGEWDETREWYALESAMPIHVRGYGPVWLNDNPEYGHADIMALFDRAIAAEKAKEASNA